MQLKDIYFEDFSDAKKVLDTIQDICKRDDFCSVYEYYGACGVGRSFIHVKTGWYHLDSATLNYDISKGWSIKLPNPRNGIKKEGSIYDITYKPVRSC